MNHWYRQTFLSYMCAKTIFSTREQSISLIMERWCGKVALITDASSGIGAAIAEKFVDIGINVMGLARHVDKLAKLMQKTYGRKGKFFFYVTDITKEEDILAAFESTKNNVGPVSILVNNAGINRPTTLSDGNTKLWKEVIDTNIMALCIATREAVRDMKANQIDGHIVHINDIVGHKVLNYPTASVHCASKFAITALGETLRNELNEAKSKIKISSVSPGVVKTEIFEAYRNSNLPLCDLIAHVLEKVPALQPEDIADAVVYVLGTPPHVQVQELIIKPVGEKM